MDDKAGQENGQDQRLRLSEEHYRLLANHMSDVIWTTDLEGRFTYVSPSVERLRGFKPEEIVGQPLEATVLPEDAREIRRMLPEVLELFRSSHTAQIRRFVPQPCRDGSTVPSEVLTNGVYDAEGNLVAILGVTRDISEQYRAEQDLRRAKEVAERALAEVRTLSGLIPICCGCHKIRDDHGYWARVEEYLESHTRAVFSHGLCPGCAATFFPDWNLEAGSLPGDGESGPDAGSPTPRRSPEP